MKVSVFIKTRRFISQFWFWIWSKNRYKFYINNYKKNFSFKDADNIINSQVFQNMISPLQIKIPKNKKILVVSPHPDDEILGASGLLVKAKNNGCHVTVVFLTSGAKKDLIVREREAQQVSDKIGIDKTYFLRLPDGDIINTSVEDTDLQDIVKKCDPDILSLPFVLDGHSDHIYSNKLICNLSFNNKNVEFWAYQIYSSIPANVVIDITSMIDHKFDLMKIYKSQLDDFDFINWNKGLNSWNSILLNSKQCKYAECYFVVPFKQYMELCNEFFYNK